MVLDDRDIIKVKNFEKVMSDISMFRLACLKFQDKLTYNEYMELKRYTDNLEKAIVGTLQ